MVDKIQIRRGTAANWTSNNPTLSAGEYALETDTGKTKMGDGSTSWTGLSYSTILPNVTETITVGYAQTSFNAGTKSSGTFTPDEANGSMQFYINGGAHTLAPPTNDTSISIQVTNNGTAGTITTTGFTIVIGDTLTTTDTDDFMFFIIKNNGFSILNVIALQ